MGNTNIRTQTFAVEVKTKIKDGCGNATKPLTDGEVRNALLSGLERADGVTATSGNPARRVKVYVAWVSADTVSNDVCFSDNMMTRVFPATGDDKRDQRRIERWFDRMERLLREKNDIDDDNQDFCVYNNFTTQFIAV